MKFTVKQLQKMGEVASESFRGGVPVEVETTNLHDGSTIVMRGAAASGSNRNPEILVTANGQSSDLSRLLTARQASV
jgi:hypothetical protein